ncbi:MAG: hypothetical protein ACYCQJ_10430 [Nitrososphaerales archaeon]
MEECNKTTKNNEWEEQASHGEEPEVLYNLNSVVEDFLTKRAQSWRVDVDFYGIELRKKEQILFFHRILKRAIDDGVLPIDDALMLAMDKIGNVVTIQMCKTLAGEDEE